MIVFWDYVCLFVFVAVVGSVPFLICLSSFNHSFCFISQAVHSDGGRSGQKQLVHFCVVSEFELQHYQGSGNWRSGQWPGTILLNQRGN